MSDTSIQIPAGYVRDRDGHLVPKDKVKSIDRERDLMVNAIFSEAVTLSGTIADFRDRCFDLLGEFVDRSAAQYGAKLGGKKGNMTLYNYDGSVKIVIQRGETKSFDERLQVAKALVDECIHEWSKGSNKNIKALVDHAFQVDTEGKVSVDRILSLRRLDIDDPRWLKAMTAIIDSMQVVGSKRYFRVYKRVGETDNYKPVSLDAASA
ncbi:DUF3164 family protein [Brucella anthropi]|uniref:DUF3164 family protein n=1 Tax=Brucella anthropi TaxID=529 RepID=UPI00124E6595|nr:DUF3164 family protein [Brucella anthropi]KAB2749881.1 DUF3164 family protein [Brucella anthropi]QPA27608.1 DUF3164 family protein [Brucella anthropi]